VAVRVDELARFVTAPVQARLMEIEGELASTAAAIRETYARLQRQRQLQTAIRRDELAADSLREQARKLREGLTGVSPEDQKLLDQRAAYESSRQFVESLERGAARSVEETSQLTSFLRRVLDDVSEPQLEELVHSEHLEKMQKELEDALTEAVGTAEAMSRRLADLSKDETDYGNARSQWRAAVSEFESHYAEASQRWTEHEQRLKELSEVEERQRSLNDALAVTKDQLRDLGDPDRAYGELRARWLELRSAHTDVMSRQCEDLTQLSEDSIRASVKVGSAIPELASALKAR